MYVYCYKARRRAGNGPGKRTGAEGTDFCYPRLEKSLAPEEFSLSSGRAGVGHADLADMPLERVKAIIRELEEGGSLKTADGKIHHFVQSSSFKP